MKTLTTGQQESLPKHVGHKSHAIRPAVKGSTDVMQDGKYLFCGWLPTPRTNVVIAAPTCLFCQKGVKKLVAQVFATPAIQAIADPKERIRAATATVASASALALKRHNAAVKAHG